MDSGSQGSVEVQVGSSADGDRHEPAPPRVPVVAAGAGARGAYEAGALSVLVPWLCRQGLRPSVFVGTSAGAINATLFAAVAHVDPPEDGAEQVLDVWRSLSLRQVFRSPFLSLPLKTVPAYAGQLLGRRGAHVVSLLDSAPLLRTGQELFAPHAQALHNNIHGPTPLVEALALVTTSDRERTTVFVDLRGGGELPGADRARAIDYERTRVTFEHVLASAAIPALFHPIKLKGRWYTDGGVRLNVPLKPAVALGATQLAVVATHPATYPDVGSAPAHGTALPPDVVDGIVGVLGVTLADRMVEDLQTLGDVNLRVKRGGDMDHRPIPYVFVGPQTRHELGALAAEVYHDEFRGLHLLRELDFAAMHRLIGPRERRGGDLLSYLFFDQHFIESAIKLGITHSNQATQSINPWSLAHGRPDGEQPQVAVAHDRRTR